MSTRFTLDSPFMPVIERRFGDKDFAARFRARREDYYEGRVWWTLCRMNLLDDEILTLLKRFGRHQTTIDVSIALKFYIISWCTLSDVTANLISAVFDLGTADQDVTFAAVMRNAHVQTSPVPAILRKHKARVRHDEFRKKRNEIVHRISWADGELGKLEWELMEAVALGFEDRAKSRAALEAVYVSVDAYRLTKQAELQVHYQDTMVMTGELMQALAVVFERKALGADPRQG